MGLGLFILGVSGMVSGRSPGFFLKRLLSVGCPHGGTEQQTVFQNLLIVELSKTAALVVTGSHGQTRSTTCKR